MEKKKPNPRTGKKTKAAESKKPSAKRKILVILSNRWNRNQKHRFFEVDADEKGQILGESPLRKAPQEPCYDEVWENDEGKLDIATCNRFRRKYPHPLEKSKQ